MTIDALTATLGPPRPACPDCGAGIGSPHVPGCDVEVCLRCGDQAVACGCVYEWDARRVPWTGRWPGEVECVELDLWSRWGSDLDPPQRGWVPCERGDPGAGPDLNRLRMTTKWDPAAQRRVRSW